MTPSETPEPSLADFVEATTALQLEAWQRILCERLERLTREQGQRVLIHGPPQFGKSIIISQRFPAWALGVKPTLRMRTACYNITHAERFSGVVLELMRDPQYVELFPDPACRVPTVARREEWSTDARAQIRDANPSMLALGLGTGFTGLGVDILVIDDPYKNAQEARSLAHNTMLWNWWQQVVLSRLNPAANVVVMFHRWWEGDFAGQLLEQGGWELLRFPAIADGGPGDPTGREAGEALSPRYPADYLREQRRLMGQAFEALYQGTPYPADGVLFTRAVDILPATPVDIVLRVRYWDKAGAAPGKGDWTVGVLLAYRACGRLLVEDVERFQAGPAERNRRIREVAALDARRPGPRVVHYIEQPPGDGVEATQGIIRALFGFPAFADPVRGSKAARVEPFVAQWQVGNVDLLEGAWNAPYLEELRAFPNGKHDDQPDASGGACNTIVAMLEAEPDHVVVDEDAPRVVISRY